MAGNSIQLEQIEFLGPDKQSVIEFAEGVNVICGASDTGKSFLAELATIKLLLTGVDDSAIVATLVESPDNGRQLALIDEIISDLSSEISDMGHEKPELLDQVEKLQATIDAQRTSMQAVQGELDERIERRKDLYDECLGFQNRQSEITDLLARFDLLQTHYAVDKERLTAIQESGSMFAHVAQAACPLCGANPDDQHVAEECEGDVDAIVNAASAEIAKINQLMLELQQTVTDLHRETDGIKTSWSEKHALFQEADAEIRSSISPLVVEARSQFSEVVEKRAEVQAAIDMFDRLEKLQERRQALIDEDQAETPESATIEAGLPEASAHALSMTIARILRASAPPRESSSSGPQS